MEFFLNIKRRLRPMEKLDIDMEELMLSVERGRQRGVINAEYDTLGVMFGAIRLDKKLTVAELSAMSGVSKENIIDLELSTFHLTEAALVAEKLVNALGIEDADFKRILASSTRKK